MQTSDQKEELKVLPARVTRADLSRGGRQSSARAYCDGKKERDVTYDISKSQQDRIGRGPIDAQTRFDV